MRFVRNYYRRLILSPLVIMYSESILYFERKKEDIFKIMFEAKSRP